jgi:hypothetical protein
VNADDPRWRTLPVLCELHDQWWAARAGKLGQSQRPFSRDWDQLLQDAELLSAEQRREAEGDARLLASAGLVEVRPVKYRPHLIARILVPVAAETRLAALFGDPTESVSPRDLSGVEWAVDLQFLKTAPVSVDLEDLLRLNRFFKERGASRPVVPIKERSIQIFGDEKRLEALLVTNLFRPGRLSPEQLRCELVGEPLGWRRGPAGSSSAPIIVLENAATWHSYARWNAEHARFSAVVYGKGFQFSTCVAYLKDVFAELGGVRPVQYFGDLDPPGVLIPYQASASARAQGLPNIEPHLWSYEQLFQIGKGKETPWDGEAPDGPHLEWLGSLARPARTLFASRRRLAQELVGWEHLSKE